MAPKLAVTVPDRYITARELITIVPYSRVHVDRLERAGKFPRRIHLGPARVAWRLSDIVAWLESKSTAKPEK